MNSSGQPLAETWVVPGPYGPLVYEPLEPDEAALVVELPQTAFSRDGRPESEVHKMGSPLPFSIDPSLHRGHILVLDDEVPLAEMLAEFLNILGYQTEICSSAPVALSLIQEKDFDLVISDFRMPCMNGEQFFKQLTTQIPDMVNRVVFVTGDTVGAEADLFFKCNPVLCLTKPYTLPAIQKVVADRLENPRSRGSETLSR